MHLKPFHHALLAELYIGLIVFVLFYGVRIFGEPAKSTEPFLPVAFLSLFVISAAVMGYLFCYKPLALYLDGEKKAAPRFFLETVGYFALMTFLVFAGILLVSHS